MKYVVFLALFLPLLKADNNFCNLPIIPDNQNLFSSREYYNDSLENSLVEFLKVVKDKDSFPSEYFSKSLESNRILLNQGV